MPIDGTVSADVNDELVDVAVGRRAAAQRTRAAGGDRFHSQPLSRPWTRDPMPNIPARVVVLGSAAGGYASETSPA